MTGRVAGALDVGSATTRLALAGRGAAPVVEARPTPGGDLAVFLSKLLEAGRARAPGAISGLTVTVPGSWLDGTAEGVRAYERLRRTILDELGWPRVGWLDQAGCVAAEAVARRARPDGPVLVCDLGAQAVGAALCAVDGASLRVTAVAVAGRDRGAGLAFDAAVAGAASPVEGFADMFAGARMRHGRRAAVVLPRAWTHPRYREAPVYQVGDEPISAGTLIGAFAGTAETLKDVVRRALAGAEPPATVAVAGRFGVFPLVSRVLADELEPSEPPLVLGPAAAVRGALRIASGERALAPADRPAVTLPLHRIRHGLLEVRQVPLDPSVDFAFQDGYPVLVEVPAEGPAPFGVQVGERDVPVRLPDLPPGPYRVGLRPSHTRPGVLVLAPAAGGEPRFYPIVPPT